MTNKRKPYAYFTKEFKQEAVRLLLIGDRHASEVAMQLGIRRNQLLNGKNSSTPRGSKHLKEEAGLIKKNNLIFLF